MSISIEMGNPKLVEEKVAKKISVEQAVKKANEYSEARYH